MPTDDRTVLSNRFSPVIFILLSMAWMAVLFHLSSLPPDFQVPFVSTNPVFLNYQVTPKIFHFFNFGVLSVLYLCGMEKKVARSNAKLSVFLLSLLLTVFYAVIDEYHQSFVPGRHPLITDVLIDMAGAITFLCIVYLLGKPIKEKKGLGTLAHIHDFHI